MPKHQLQPRKTPLQQRSHLMVGTILEAAARVLRKESLEGFNTNRVAAVAGISVGSLYQYFPNKAALVAALIAREQAALGSAIEHCVAVNRGRPLASRLPALVDIAIEHQFGNPIYAAALDHEERRLPLDSVLAATQHRIVHAVQMMLNEHRKELASTLPAEAAMDCLTITKALIEAEALQTKPKLAMLRRRVLRALFGYLRYQAPGRRSPSKR